METSEELTIYAVQVFEIIKKLEPKEALQVMFTLSTIVYAAIIQDRTLEDVFENGMYKKKE